MDNNVVNNVLNALVEKVSDFLLETPGVSLGVSFLAFVSVLVFFFRSELKELISRKARRREGGISKGDDVRSSPSDTAPTGDHPQGSESGRVPEKREEQRDEAPEPAPDLSGKPNWWRIVKAAVVVVLAVMAGGGGYFIAEQVQEIVQVERWLREAKADLLERRLNNAGEKYQAVLRLSPSNIRALTGRQSVLKGYMELFGEELARGNLRRTGNYLVLIRSLHPNSPLLAKGKKRLDEAKVKAAAEARAKAAAKALLVREMVEIPGGTFRMGDLSVSGVGGSSELPVHSVAVPSFWMGKYEVTFSQWDACVADGGCSYRPDDKGWGRGRGPHPVINVSWDDVQEFIAWLNTKTGGGYRLPTESEWEYAARAGSESLYTWGDEIGVNRANCAGCGGRRRAKTTAPGGGFSANAWGLHDMHGNVWEWVEDCWNDNYRGAPVDESAWLSGDCSQRVIRGGSWDGPPWDLRSSNRNWNYRYRSFRDFFYLGFRLARDR